MSMAPRKNLKQENPKWHFPKWPSKIWRLCVQLTNLPPISLPNFSEIILCNLDIRPFLNLIQNHEHNLALDKPSANLVST